MDTKEYETIDYVEYHGPNRDQPCCLITDGYRFWDFEECKLNGNTYYHESGGGRIDRVDLPQFIRPPDPPIPVYIRPGLRVECADSPGLSREARPEDFARLGLVRIDAPLGDPFENAVEGKTVYCRHCDDWLPDDRDDICSHVWYGPEGLDGPGCDETEEEVGAAFIAWATREEEHVDTYDFADWRKGAWAAWKFLWEQRKDS